MPGILKSLFHFSFWFDFFPDPFVGWSATLFVRVFGFLVLAALALFFFERRAQKQGWFDKPLRRLFRGLASCLFWAGIVGFVLYWFTEERIPILSMRVFFLVWFFVFAGWAFFIRKRLSLDRRAVKRDMERATYEKWLPKPKYGKR